MLQLSVLEIINKISMLQLSVLEITTVQFLVCMTELLIRSVSEQKEEKIVRQINCSLAQVRPMFT